MPALFAFLASVFGVIASLLSTATTILLIGWIVVLIAPELTTVVAATILGYVIKAAISMIVAWILTGLSVILAVISA